MSEREHRISKSMPVGATANIPNQNGGVDRVDVSFNPKAVIGWLAVIGIVSGGGAGLTGVIGNALTPSAEIQPANVKEAVEEAAEDNAEAIRVIQTEQRIQGIQIEIIEEDVAEIKETGKEMHGTLDEVLIEVKAAARARTLN